MVNNNDCYIELAPKSLIRDKLLDISMIGEWDHFPKIGTFFKKTPSKELLELDPFLKLVCEKYKATDGPWGRNANIFKLDPWTHYMLHTDERRSCSINMLINNETDSICYFQTSDVFNQLHFNIKELAYKKDTYYLFNSKIPHAITNRHLPRYLLSITLNCNFEEAVNIFKNLELTA